MNTTSFQSDIKTIQASQRSVYDKLADMGNLERMVAGIPSDKLKDIKVSDGCLTFPTMMGEISLKLSEAQPYGSIRYSTVKSPVPFTLNILLGHPAASQCTLQLVGELELNPFLLKMAQKPITDALNRIAEAMTMINY